MKYEYQLTLRLNEKLAGRIKERTKTTKRSMNSEIIHLLENAIMYESKNDSPEIKLQHIISLAQDVIDKIKP